MTRRITIPKDVAEDAMATMKKASFKINLLKEQNIKLKGALIRADTLLFNLSNAIEDLIVRNINDLSLTDVNRIAANRKRISELID